ncbi:arginine--tRNA ligase [Candidatus Microgenomates bacterium]|nr:arginine--tRNA ligase [Candidatus Microgenomates bacterium]
MAAQEILKKDKGWQPIIDYRQYVQGKEGRLEEVREVYGAGLKWSLEYFETIYKRLGTKFDGYYPESWVGEYGMKLVEKGLKMGVLEKSEGGIIYRGERDGLHTRVFVNKLGLPTYEAKDLGLAMAKYKDFQYDLSINVFGKEIDEYYKVVKAAMKKIEPELGEKAYHIAHGMVRLPEGKMSSRSGNVITFEWLLGEAKKRVLEIIEKTDRKAENVKNSGEIAEKVALGAVRYALLKNNIGNDIVFDFGKSVSFEGDSGPYLMYTYARCKSVLRKSKINETMKPFDSAQGRQFNNETMKYNPEELSLLRLFYRFPEVVSEAAATFSPHLLCAYLFELAQCYSLFYQKHTILKSDFRLALTQTTASLIKRGLFILGIETVEKM